MSACKRARSTEPKSELDSDVDKRTRIVDEYVKDLRDAARVFHAQREGAGPPMKESIFYLLNVDESFESDPETHQTGKVNNVRTLLSLAEGIRQRRMDTLRVPRV